MKNSSRFFSNIECEYYPCHSGVSEFNCLFCYCPLYLIKDCGGKFKLINDKIKDCSECLIPHTPAGYDIIMKKLRENTKS